MKIDKVFSDAGVEIVARPYLVEDELSTLSQRCSEDWVRWLMSSGHVTADATPTSLEILNGGKFYYTQAAWNAVHSGNNCRLLKLRARRGHASGETYGGDPHHDKNLEAGMELYRSPGSDWCVRIWEIPEDLAFPGPVLVGDTIATGTTLVGVLGWLVSKMVAAKSVQDIHVFTIVGASDWSSGDGGVVDKLKFVDEELCKHGKALTVCFCNATFGLATNGTDLNPAPSHGAEWLPDALAKTTQIVGSNFPLEKLKCGVWDWGDRFTKPLHHLEEVLEHYEAQSDAPQYIVTGLRERIAERRETAPPDAKKAKGSLKRNMSKSGDAGAV